MERYCHYDLSAVSACEYCLSHFIRFSVYTQPIIFYLVSSSNLQVRLCKDRTTDNLFAIKIISKEMLKKRKSGNTTETYFEDIRREIAIMKKLLHPNVLRLYEVLDDPNVSRVGSDRPQITDFSAISDDFPLLVFSPMCNRSTRCT
jgi:serine/threonine protein kinase